MAAALKHCSESGEIIVEHEIIRVSYARECHEEHARCCDGGAEFHDGSVKSHALCFPRCERPAEDERELRESHILLLRIAHGLRKDRHPGSTFRFREEWWTLVLRAIDENAQWHAQRSIVVHGTGSWREENAFHSALRSVHETELYVQVVSDDHARFFR